MEDKNPLHLRANWNRASIKQSATFNSKDLFKIFFW